MERAVLRAARLEADQILRGKISGDAGERRMRVVGAFEDRATRLGSDSLPAFVERRRLL